MSNSRNSCGSEVQEQNHGANNNFHISQSFRDQKQIEAFIRSNKLMKFVEGAADNYVKTYQQTKRPEDALAPVVVRMPFVYEEFLSQPVELLHLALEEPHQFTEAARYCVYSIVRDFVKNSSAVSGLKTVDIDQVHVQLSFLGLPLQQDLLFDPSRHCYHTGLSLAWGVLSAFTEPEKVVLQSVWFCTTGCTRNKIRSESIEAPICNSCSRPMSEYTKLRATQHFSLLRLLPFDSVQTPRTVNKIFRALTVCVRDHTYDCELTLGTRYLITGYYDYRSSAQQFQAWNLIKN